jgi:hypothetical protein
VLDALELPSKYVVRVSRPRFLPFVVRDAIGDQALAQFGRRDRPHAAGGGIQFERMGGQHLWAR